jgi:S-layer homology domain
MIRIFSILEAMWKTISRYILASIFVWSIPALSAATLPFQDIPLTAPYFESVQSLYEQGIITDDGSGLFKPDSLMDRDLYVALAV